MKKHRLTAASLLAVICTYLGITVVLCLLHANSMGYFIMLSSLLLGALIMGIYCIIAWQRLNIIERWSIVTNIIAWLCLFCLFSYENGITLGCMFSI